MNFIQKYFQLSKHQTSLRTELVAACTTFSTMAYIIVINPLILSLAGMDFSSVMIATILAAALSTILMGLYAHYPFALAPGMGMNAYFTYSVVLGMHISWETALGIVFLTGVLLLILWITGLRELIVKAMPKGIKIGTTAGVGLFLVVVALSNAKIIVSHPQTLLQLGNLAEPNAYLTFVGILLITALLSWRIPGAILIGILFNWLLGLLLGIIPFKGLVDLPHFNLKTFLALDLQKALSPDLWMVTFSFLFICLFDSSGSLMGIAHQGRFLDKEGKLSRLRRALLPDGIGTFFGALLGTSPTSVYVESASGVAAGGRTGLSALFIALLFVLALFFEPLAASIPIFAVTPVLIIIGAMMMSSLKELDWEMPSDLIPGFMTLIGIPLTYSIGIGIGMGLILYPLCKLCAGKVKEVHWLVWVLAALFIFEFIGRI